jgi:hypothetical protein
MRRRARNDGGTGHGADGSGSGSSVPRRGGHDYAAVRLTDESGGGSLQCVASLAPHRRAAARGRPVATRSALRTQAEPVAELGLDSTSGRTAPSCSVGEEIPELDVSGFVADRIVELAAVVDVQRVQVRRGRRIDLAPVAIDQSYDRLEVGSRELIGV